MSRLVLSRKVGERINIGDNIVVQVVSIDRGRIQLAIIAPADVKIFRDEIDPRHRQDDPPPSYRPQAGG